MNTCCLSSFGPPHLKLCFPSRIDLKLLAGRIAYFGWWVGWIISLLWVKENSILYRYNFYREREDRTIYRILFLIYVIFVRQSDLIVRSSIHLSIRSLSIFLDPCGTKSN
nr:hypothetical protein Q903MT_gene1364 [Picea sitchensis]